MLEPRSMHPVGLRSLSDEEAMLRVQTKSDPCAFALLVQRWEDRIKGFCSRRMGDFHLGEDLAQEVFLRLFQHRKDYRNEGPFSVYLYRIAMNTCYDELRRLKRRGKAIANSSKDREFEADTGKDISVTMPLMAAVAQEQAELVRKALLRLPEHYQDVIVLRHYGDLKFREVAAVLDIPDGTVKSRMAKALTILAQRLKHLRGEEKPRISNSSQENLQPKQESS